MQAGAWLEVVAGGVPYRLEVQLSWVAVIMKLLPSLLLFHCAATVKLSVILCLSDCPLSTVCQALLVVSLSLHCTRAVKWMAAGAEEDRSTSCSPAEDSAGKRRPERTRASGQEDPCGRRGDSRGTLMQGNTQVPTEVPYRKRKSKTTRNAGEDPSALPGLQPDETRPGRPPPLQHRKNSGWSLIAHSSEASLSGSEQDLKPQAESACKAPATCANAAIAGLWDDDRSCVSRQKANPSKSPSNGRCKLPEVPSAILQELGFPRSISSLCEAAKEWFVRIDADDSNDIDPEELRFVCAL